MSERRRVSQTIESQRSGVVGFEDTLIAANQARLGLLAHQGFALLPGIIENAQKGFATDNRLQPARREFHLAAAQSHLEDLREWQRDSQPQKVFYTIIPNAVTALQQDNWKTALAQTVALERHLQAGDLTNRWPIAGIRFQRELMNTLVLNDLLRNGQGLSLCDDDLKILPRLISQTLKVGAALSGLRTCDMFSPEQATLHKALIEYTAEQQKTAQECVDFFRRSTGPDTVRLSHLVDTLNHNAKAHFGLRLPLIAV